MVPTSCAKDALALEAAKLILNSSRTLVEGEKLRSNILSQDFALLLASTHLLFMLFRGAASRVKICGT
jgi:hypothetical protein